MPDLLAKWRADLGRVLGEELVIELRRRGAGELLTILDALERNNSELFDAGLRYKNRANEFRAEARYQRSRADAAEAALDRVRALHQPYERDPVCRRDTCPCAEPRIACTCGKDHSDWPTAYPCLTVQALEGDS